MFRVVMLHKRNNCNKFYILKFDDLSKLAKFITNNRNSRRIYRIDVPRRLRLALVKKCNSIGS